MTSLQGDDDTTSSGHNQMTSRKELQDDLRRYITETFNYINSVRGFCDKISEWVDKRKTESKKVVDIKDRADKLDLNLRHVYQSKKKGKALLEYGMSKVAGVNADKRRAELEKELVAVLSDTWKGLEELNHFLGAVEKLVVTSLHVFMENQVLHLPKGISLDVQVIIATARLICPLLIEFKRDSRVFSLPKLQNAVVLSNQLERYIKTTQIICDELEKRSVGNFCQTKPVVGIHVNLSKENMERMIHHVNELLRIRKDKDFQTVFIFPEGHCSHFITEFSKRQSKLQSLLTKLKDIAIRLDKVNKGIKIAYVAGSSVGAIGSVLSIVGLALSPLTLGASLPLTMAGLGMGIACGVSSAVTTSTKIGVNRKQQKKAACVFQSIKKDVESIQQCLEEVKMEKGKPDVTLGVTSVVLNVGNLGYNVHNIVECGAGGVCDVVEISADIGQAVASAGLAARAFLLVFDVCSIIKNCVSLAKDAESEASQPIRDSADLLQSVIDSWQEIYESLIQGQKTFEENKAILDKAFYPENWENKEHRDKKSTTNDIKNKEQAHVEAKQAHVKVKQAHKEADQTHVQHKQAHVQHKQAHVQHKQAHVQHKQAHMKDKQAHMEAKQAHVKAKQAHVKAKQAHVEAKQAHVEDKQAHVEDKQACLKNNQAHVKEPAQVKDTRQVHCEKLMLKICTVFVKLLNPVGPCGGSIITSCNF